MQEILLNHPSLMSRNFEMQGCQWYVVKRIKSTFADKGNSEKSLKHLFIISSDFHFFNETDLEP